MSEPLRIAIRADAGHWLGTGHFGRASAVARVLAASLDVRVFLLTEARSLDLVAAYFPAEIEVVALAPGESAPALALAVLAERHGQPDALYLDHYGEVAAWETAAADARLPLLVLDDLHEARTASIIVRVIPEETAPRLAENSLLLLGPAYLPISEPVARRRPDIAAATAPAVHDPDTQLSVTRINVCFGGSDPTRETAKALSAIRALSHVRDIAADVVIGPGADYTPSELAAFASQPGVHLHRQPTQDTLAALLARAQIALGAGGVMLWERLCLGVPSLVVASADNQLAQIGWASAQGAIRFLGRHDRVTPETMRLALEDLLGTGEDRARLARNGLALVDGHGALRVAALLQSLAFSPRPVCQDDAHNLYDWRSRALEARFTWSGDAMPSFEDHCAWLRGTLDRPDRIFRIIECRGRPLGVVRFDLDTVARRADLSIYLVPDRLGQRLGLSVYFAAERVLCLQHSHITEVTSLIHGENSASQRFHVVAGFQLKKSSTRAGWLTARKPLTCACEQNSVLS